MANLANSTRIAKIFPAKTARHPLETARHPPNILIVGIRQSFAPPKIALYGSCFDDTTGPRFVCHSLTALCSTVGYCKAGVTRCDE